MRLTLSYRDHPVRTPVGPSVHKAPPGQVWTVATSYTPPFPGRVPGKGFPVWTLSHRGRALVFASPEEIAHVADILSQRVLPRPWKLVGGARAYGMYNRHWLSRLHKSWTPWPIRQEIVRRLRAAL